MIKTIEAVFDGQVIKPEGPLMIEPNTRMRVTIETVELITDKATSFLHTARSLHLDGPPDWAKNLDAYLYKSDRSA
jgi:predicted DNA-binding antitoxin AbrB/MazE fold protein